jgi:gas vesicle protein
MIEQIERQIRLFLAGGAAGAVVGVLAGFLP